MTVTDRTLSHELNDIAAAIGRLPSGCSILTVAHGDRRTGILLSWIQQAAFEPPLITVCIKNGRCALELIESAGRFLLNVVGDEPAAMFKHFGRGFGPEDDAFHGLVVEPTEFGPSIAECIAHLGCRVVNRVACGDHTLFVAEVVKAAAQDGRKPYVHLRKNGLSY
jgi:flavin reductase (DIM6/NTAB) family NADH-FMN oxidoreductase RutF